MGVSWTGEEGPKDRAPGACMGQFKGKRDRGGSGRTKDAAGCLSHFKGKRDRSRLPITRAALEGMKDRTRCLG